MPATCFTAAMFRSILPTEKRKPSTHARPAPGRESKLTACLFLYSTLDAARLTNTHLSSSPRSLLETNFRMSSFFCFVRVVLIPTPMKNNANKSEKNCFTLPIWPHPDEPSVRRPASCHIEGEAGREARAGRDDVRREMRDLFE